MPQENQIQIVCPDCNAINRVVPDKLHASPVCGKCRSKLFTGQPTIASDHTFQKIIQKTDIPVVVDFWAPWCGPCKQFGPIFSEVADQLKTTVCFIKLDTESNQQTAQQYQIRSIPTIALFYKGKEVTRLSGALSKSQFIQWIKGNLSGK